ncbi:TPA: replication initiator protein A [Streptococcus suis]
MNRITLEQVQTSERFYKIPKVLFEARYYKKLSTEAKCAYGILKDRFDLSIKNKWIDENGCVYLIFRIEELQEILGYGNKKIIKLKKELTVYGLLEEVRQGMNKPNLLYLGNVLTDSELLNSDFEEVQESLPQQEVSKRHVRKCQNDTSGNVESTFHEVSKRHGNETNISETDISETNFIIDEDEKNGSLRRIVENVTEFDKDYIYTLVSTNLLKEVKRQSTVDFYMSKFDSRYKLALKNLRYIPNSERLAEYVYNGILSEISKDLRKSAG